MPLVTVVLGTSLIVLGLGGYIATGMASWTAMIPAVFGLPLILLGVVARAPGRRKHAMHAAATLSLVGLAGGAMGIPKLATMMSGGEAARPAAAISQSIMALLCVVFLALCVKSFIDARRLPASPQSQV